MSDRDIRSALVERLHRQKPGPKRILEELTVHNGKAIADVVAIFQAPHCYEIKSDTDNVSRAVAQSKYYDLVFKRITLVTTERHVLYALKTLPAYWGVVSAKREVGKISFKHYRKASFNPTFSARQALMTLWKVELLELAKGQDVKWHSRLNRSELAESISEKISSKSAERFIGDFLIKRQY